MIKAGYMQFEPRFGDVDGNLERVLSALENVDADLMVLPELAFTGYAFADRAEAREYAHDPADSEIVRELHALCARRDIYVVTGFAELAGRQIFNSALLIGPGGIAASYRKLHLFNTEKNCFDPGDRPIQVLAVKEVRIGMMICFDWIFPEVARQLTLAGAEIICHPCNLVIPEKCQYSMVTRCVENKVFAITANRYGSERGIDFTGGSQMVAPDGEVLNRGPASGDEIFIAALDNRRARDKHINPANDLLVDLKNSLPILT